MSHRASADNRRRTLSVGRGSVPHIFGIALFDQGIISASNLVLTVIAARVAGIHGLGRLTVVATVIFVSLSLARTVIMEPMLLVSKDRGHRVAPHALIATCCGFSVTSFWTVLVVTGSGAAAASGAGLTTVAIIQDFTRYAGFREGTSTPALQSDLTVLLVTIIGGVLASFLAKGQANVILSVWLAALTCGVMVNVSRLQWRRKSSYEILWRRDLFRHSRFLAPDIIAFLAGTHVILLILASTGGEARAATARAALTLLAPMVLVFSAASVILTPHWVAASRDAVARLFREAWIASMVIGGLGVILTSFLILSSAWLPQLVFGNAVRLDPLELGIAGFALILLGVGTPLLILAKVYNALRPVVIVRSTSAGAALLVMATVKEFQDANGYFLLIAAQSLLSLLVLLQLTRSGSGRRRAELREGPYFSTD